MKYIKLCDHKPKLVYSIGDVKYYASDADNIHLFEGDLILNLSREPGIKVASNIWNIPSLAPHMEESPEEICLMWHDFAAPPVKTSFWSALNDYARLKGYTKICFHCGHGHGRTGTGICSMMVANGLSAEDAIKKLRNKYCKQAVESDIQVYYLLALDEKLNGRSLPETDEELEKKVYSLTPNMPAITFNNKDFPY